MAFSWIYLSMIPDEMQRIASHAFLTFGRSLLVLCLSPGVAASRNPWRQTDGKYIAAADFNRLPPCHLVSVEVRYEVGSGTVYSTGRVEPSDWRTVSIHTRDEPLIATAP
jgi:hypothetical protein